MSLAYNTLFEIKRQLGGIGLPPYTPLSAETAVIVNPEYVAGMGAIKADPELGLQCPICGKWLPAHLGSHVGLKHKDIGGAAGLKKLLGYSPANALVTVEEHKREHNQGVRIYKAGGFPRNIGGAPHHHGKTQSTFGHGRQNLDLSCRVQMVAHFHKLAKKLGRQPRKRDWEREKLPWAFGKASPVYESWNALVIAAGGTPRKHSSSQPTDFCKRGHPLTAANRFRNGKGCRLCLRISQREYERKVAQRGAP